MYAVPNSRDGHKVGGRLECCSANGHFAFQKAHFGFIWPFGRGHVTESIIRLGEKVVSEFF